DLIDEVEQLHRDSDFAVHVEDALESLKAGATKGALVQLVGDRSAGKTTFLKRFYTRHLDRKQRDKIVFAYVPFEGMASVSVDAVGRYLLKIFEDRLFGQDGPDNGQLLEVFKREWIREQRSLPDFVDSDALRADFTRSIKARINAAPLEYVQQ